MKLRVRSIPADFCDLLDSLGPAGKIAASDTPGLKRRGFSFTTAGEQRGRSRACYLRHLEEETVDAKYLLSIDPACIAEELALSPGYSIQDLIRIRRNFAARYHPDLAPPEFRTRATTRMQIANDLIDRFIAGIKGASKSADR